MERIYTVLCKDWSSHCLHIYLLRTVTSALLEIPLINFYIIIIVHVKYHFIELLNCTQFHSSYLSLKVVTSCKPSSVANTPSVLTIWGLNLCQFSA